MPTPDLRFDGAWLASAVRTIVRRHGYRICLTALLAACSTGIPSQGSEPPPWLVVATEPEVPLADGHYRFRHRFAEHPDMASQHVEVRIDGRRVWVRNTEGGGALPLGALEEGWLMWHAAAGRWVIAQTAADRQAPEVGGCSDGPTWIDLQQQVYWTC